MIFEVPSNPNHSMKTKTLQNSFWKFGKQALFITAPGARGDGSSQGTGPPDVHTTCCSSRSFIRCLVKEFQPTGQPQAASWFRHSRNTRAAFPPCAGSVRKGRGVFPPGGVILSTIMYSSEGQVTSGHYFLASTSQK